MKCRCWHGQPTRCAAATRSNPFSPHPRHVKLRFANLMLYNQAIECARCGTVKRGQIGRFQLKQGLGRGGFGTVYLALDTVLDRPVALKIPTFRSTETRKTARFLREAKAAARLSHPNIAKVYDAGQEDPIGNRIAAAEIRAADTPVPSMIDGTTIPADQFSACASDHRTHLRARAVFTSEEQAAGRDGCCRQTCHKIATPVPNANSTLRQS